jgi:hypothetical protein
MKRHALGLAGVCALLLGTTPAQSQTLPVPIPAVNDPRFSNLSIPSTAPTQGMWSAQFSWPLVGLHVALLPDGQVLTYGTPLGQGVQDGRTFDRWDPLTATVTAGHTTVANSAGVDSFCSAGVLQTGGAMLVSGGDSNATSPTGPNSALNSTVFDYFNNTTTTQPLLASDRWYPTMLVLADGRSLIIGGADAYATGAYASPDANLAVISMTPEVWTPGIGWSSLPGANSRTAFGPDFNRWWYPRAWVAPNGRVFGISAEKWWYLDPSGNGSIPMTGNFKTGYDNNTRPNIGPTSTAVMYDVGRILQVGGNGPTNGFASNSSALASTFNINGASPGISDTAPMAFPRQWANTTVLPNGRVLVTGGTRFGDNGGTDAVFAAEWWNPANGTWSTLASAAVIRNYHSATALLPSGIVLSTGGGVPGPVNNLNAEMFYPPYLFTTVGSQAQLANRPRMISASSTRFNYGATFQIEMADTRTISRVVVIGLSSTTHSFNTGQRLIPLTFSQANAILTITAPASVNLAPPGYYQVIALDSAGVPSRGFIIQSPMAARMDPAAQYPMDQSTGTTVNDTSGNGRNGALVSGATWTTGRTGNAVRIAGGTQYVDLPDGIVQSCADFTFAAWVNLASNPNWNRIFDFGSNTTTNMFLTPRAGGATVRFAITQGGGGAEQRISFATDFVLNQWRHVAVVLQGNTGRLYLNGAEVANNTNLTLDPLNMGTTVNNWLGRSQYSADPRMNGSIDDVRISCRAFSAQEIATLAGM